MLIWLQKNLHENKHSQLPKKYEQGYKLFSGVDVRDGIPPRLPYVEGCRQLVKICKLSGDTRAKYLASAHNLQSQPSTTIKNLRISTVIMAWSTTLHSWYCLIILCIRRWTTHSTLPKGKKLVRRLPRLPAQLATVKSENATESCRPVTGAPSKQSFLISEVERWLNSFQEPAAMLLCQSACDVCRQSKFTSHRGHLARKYRTI